MVRWTLLLLLVLLAGCSGGTSDSIGDRGAPPPRIDDDRRLEILEEVRAFRDGQAGTNSDEELLALARFLDAIPEIDGVAIAVDGSVWALFSDGRLLVVADNRPPSTQIVSRDPWLAATELPAAAEAWLANAFEVPGCFDSPVATIRGALAPKGYTVSEGAEVSDFRLEMGTLGLLYVDAHGADLALAPASGSRGLVLGRAPPQEFALWTSTDVTPAGERLWRGDLDANRLVYLEASTNQADGSCSPEVHYAITGRFVRQYLQFSPDSFVFVNACQSDSDRLKQAFLDKGASAYAGWTHNVDDDVAHEAAAAMFPLMAGSDVDPGFDLADAMADLQDRGLDQSLDTGARLVFTTVPDGFGQLVPILESARPSGERLALRGKFGSTPGRILIDGDEVPVLGAWDPLLLECEVPEGTQFVAVEVRGHLSNRLPVTGGDAPTPPRGGVGALGGYWEGTGHDVPEGEGSGELKVSFLFEVGESSNGGQSAEITGRLQVALQLFPPENGTPFTGTVSVTDSDPLTLSFSFRPDNDPGRQYTGQMTGGTLTGTFVPGLSAGSEGFVFTCTPGTPPAPED